ncbi:MAG: Tat pathway signal sequence protein, partial [Bacteroidetes bacterium]|nr:Tat pathway signal sequence protein [Bacteroidota bacterium]
MSPEIEAMICRMRYDFEVTKAELLEERFIRTYVEWCKGLNVKSRAQAYGRGFFPLESSFHYDIPESESWTMNWLKHKVGEEMPEDDYRRGRAYTMISKYVSSAANLTGKRIVSCEEMTDTYTVFNVLPPNDDMWSNIGAQMEPFPSLTNAEYFTLIWEAINKNGNGCDFVSQRVISNTEIKKGIMHYGPRKYHTLFLVQVDSLSVESARKLCEFVVSGGRVFCIESYPSRSLGWNEFERMDAEVKGWIEKMKSFPDRFILVKKPDKDYITWYKNLQEKYSIDPYIKIENPDPFVMQNRYRADDGSEIFYIIHSHIHNSHKTKISFPGEIIRNKQCWIWDPVDGKRYRTALDKDNSLTLEMGPAESFLFVFDRQKKGPDWKPMPAESSSAKTILNGWSLE